MAGAAILCGRSAIKSGAGLVQFLLPSMDSPLLPILQISVPEATCITPASCHLDSFTSIACGSGLGQSSKACRLLTWILDSYKGILILDADALNMTASRKELAEKVRSSEARIIMTPHIGEARRLLHTDARIAGPDARAQAVCELAEQYHCIAVLKGAGTLVCDGSAANPLNDHIFHIYQNTTGNPGMATGGSGDSLTGLTAAFAAQGYAPVDAARAGVYIHGLAGDLAARELGEMGMTAADLVQYLPYALKQFLS